jgi:nucleotide-binding universal stress UspA family protein
MTTAASEIKAKPGRQLLRLKTILVAVDFSPPSDQALRYATRLAIEFGSDLTILHVIDGVSSRFPDYPALPTFSSEELKEAEERLIQIARRLTTKKLNAGHAFRIGLAAHEIVEAAKQLAVDLIVIATHGFTGWKHFYIGSTAERVVRAAPCPVLVVREKEHEFI